MCSSAHCPFVCCLSLCVPLIRFSIFVLFSKVPGPGWGANPGSFDFVYFLIPSLYSRATATPLPSLCFCHCVSIFVFIHLYILIMNVHDTYTYLCIQVLWFSVSVCALCIISLEHVTSLLSVLLYFVALSVVSLITTLPTAKGWRHIFIVVTSLRICLQSFFPDVNSPIELYIGTVLIYKLSLKLHFLCSVFLSYCQLFYQALGTVVPNIHLILFFFTFKGHPNFSTQT
jgi:hypothetical protein